MARIDLSPKSFCKTMGLACASLRCHILISDGDSCRLIAGGSPCLLRFFEVGVAVVAATRDALAVAISGLVVLIAFLSLVLAPFLGSEAAFLAGQSLSK